MSAAELAVRNLVGDIPTTITWNDEAKKLFKETFGAEDPLAFKTDVEKRLAEAELNLADANDGRVYKKTVENMSPALQRAFQLELQGKKEEAIQYLRSMPDSLLQNKEAKSLTDKQLLDTYEPGQVSDEEWKAMETGNFDDLGVDERVLKHKVKTLRQLAERAHETKRASIQEDLRAQEAQIRQAQEMEQKAIAAAVAKAKNDPLTKAFITPQTIDQFASQQLLRDMLFDPSGVTSENQMTNLLKAKHFDEVMVAQKDYWYKKGLQDGAQEATAKVPSGPQGSGRAVASPPQQQPDLARSILQQVAKQA